MALCQFEQLLEARIELQPNIVDASCSPYNHEGAALSKGGREQYTAGHIAGWNADTIRDIKGTSILASWLCSDPELRFLPAIASVSSYPNFDGHIEFGENSGSKVSPVGRADIQVKSTGQSLVNENTRGKLSDYKYQCETEIFSAVLRGVSANPAFLFIVDVPNERIFRIPLTRDYAESLNLKPNQKHVTIYFNEADELSDYNRFFREIVVSRDNTGERFERALEYNLVCPDDTSEENKRELIAQVHKLNLRLETDLYFLKKWSFENTWRIGLLYREEEDGYFLALAAMEYNEGDFIALQPFVTRESKDGKGFFPLAPALNDDAHFAVMAKKGTPFSESVDKLIEIWCEDLVRSWFIPPEAMSDDLLCEIAYYYLDLLAKWVPQLSGEEEIARFRPDSMTAKEFKQKVDAVLYAFEKHHDRFMDIPDIEHGPNDVLLCHTPKKRENAPDWFVDSVMEYLESEANYQDKYNLMVICKQISFPLIVRVAKEIFERNISVERIWRESPLEEVRARHESRPPHDKYSPNLPKYFDYWTTKDVLIDDFARFAKTFGPTREKAASVFFGDRLTSPIRKVDSVFTLYIDDQEARVKKWVCNSAQEASSLESIMPFSDWMEPKKEEFENMEAKHGTPVSCAYLEAPEFVGALPLYCEIEKYLMEEMNKIAPSSKLKWTSLTPRRKRSDYISYTISWNWGYMSVIPEPEDTDDYAENPDAPRINGMGARKSARYVRMPDLLMERDELTATKRSDAKVFKEVRAI